MVRSGARVGTLCGSGWPSEGPPNPPSPRANLEATSVANGSPFSSFSTVLFRITGALVLALVEGIENGRIGNNVSGDRQRLVEGDVALAVNHHHAVEIHLAGP